MILNRKNDRFAGLEVKPAGGFLDITLCKLYITLLLNEMQYCDFNCNSELVFANITRLSTHKFKTFAHCFL